ncbi:hypothetical protein HO133_007049 [Letharia lupina]|uniref:Uncharacterized protein n=1 Tax=Letharia lupina TaxID=560253 RepID=A0A8H6FI41_9LECA|nr:uncharacterized protein HO133_007049 [Letharia lupina]KAF6228937.1 hypothetical protein HO133_007049 [Letharia lupina]
MLEALRETSREIDQPIMIVTDGLDECNMNERKDFIKVLTGLKKTSWKSLVTSRFDQDVLSQACDGCFQFSIKDENVEDDIRNFVDSALRGNEPVDNMLSDRAFRLEVIETLTSRAHGIDGFLVSGLAFSAYAKQVLLGLPSKSRIAESAPITALAMSHAIGVSHVLDSNRYHSKLSEDEIPNPASIIGCCMGLNAMDPVIRVVTLAHFDIAKYMQTHRGVLFSWKGKLMLANITLAYLSLEAFSTGLCRQADAFTRRLEAYPFLDYASRHWGHHAREAMLLQDADAKEGKQTLVGNLNGLLNDRMNLESSLQIRSVSKLPVAAHHGFSAIARELMKSQPELVFSQDDFRTSAVHEAARAGWDGLVDVLLQAGAPPSPKDKDEKAPVHSAPQYQHHLIALK